MAETPQVQLPARRRQIADAARHLLEAEGPDALTMRRIGEALGIKAPSLYKHLPDKTALEAQLVADAFTELAEAMEAASANAASPTVRLAAVARAYRRYAVDHPHLYRLMNYRPLRRDLLPDDLENRSALPLLEAVEYDEARARAMWAFAHGMVSLEIDNRFPSTADLDAAWQAGLAAFS
ncbi:TetR/AcrR family transcriptional regulator [Actinopolymorpha alba]|uniref:TetR/AcrR family transcriptional regulator n=1 Tax=Actinopolymorpha alba TaxID=533267 RepID=UPI00036DD5C7|nr:TetR/AcrR family transcriptional regulator [Actinopolymorpha alba]